MSAPIDTPYSLTILPCLAQSRRQRYRSQGRFCARCRPQEDEDHQSGVRRLRVFAFVMSAPIDTPHHPPPLPCSQSLMERPRSRRRSRFRQGPEGQLHAAITKVRRLWLEPTPECSPSCQRPLTLLNTRLLSCTRRLVGNDVGPEGGAALAEGLKGNSTLQSLE